MACTLSIAANPPVDFEGKTGKDFTITITPAPGSSLQQVHATYNGKDEAGTEATFTVAAGRKTLLVTYAAAQLGETGSLAEICGGTPSPLRGIVSTEIFTRRYRIEGK